MGTMLASVVGWALVRVSVLSCLRRRQEQCQHCCHVRTAKPPQQGVQKSLGSGEHSRPRFGLQQARGGQEKGGRPACS